MELKFKKSKEDDVKSESKEVTAEQSEAKAKDAATEEKTKTKSQAKQATGTKKAAKKKKKKPSFFLKLSEASYESRSISLDGDVSKELQKLCKKQDAAPGDSIFNIIFDKREEFFDVIASETVEMDVKLADATWEIIQYYAEQSGTSHSVILNAALRKVLAPNAKKPVKKEKKKPEESGISAA